MKKKNKQRAVPISIPITNSTTNSNVSQSPQWSDRFRQLRRSLQGRAMKNSVSPQPTEKVAIFEEPDAAQLPPTPKPTPKQRSKSRQLPQSSPYDTTASQSPAIHRTTLTVEASKVSSDAEQSDKSVAIDPPKTAAIKRQQFRRSRSVATNESKHEPITTHFPINNTNPVTTKHGDQFDSYGGYILGDADQKSSHAESGYLSALELSIPRSTSVWSQTSPPMESPPTRENYQLPPRPSSRGTIFDRQASIRSKSRAATPEPQRRSRLSSAKSETNLRRYERSNSANWALDMLRDRIQVFALN